MARPPTESESVRRCLLQVQRNNSDSSTAQAFARTSSLHSVPFLSSAGELHPSAASRNPRARMSCLARNHPRSESHGTSHNPHAWHKTPDTPEQDRHLLADNRGTEDPRQRFRTYRGRNRLHFPESFQRYDPDRDFHGILDTAEQYAPSQSKVLYKTVPIQKSEVRAEFPSRQENIHRTYGHPDGSSVHGTKPGRYSYECSMA